MKPGSIVELEHFFNNNPLPSGEVKLSPCETIIDVRKFIDSHMSVIKSKKGIKTYKPYYDRLIKLKNIINEISGSTEDSSGNGRTSPSAL
jgi:hypothetical protein